METTTTFKNEKLKDILDDFENLIKKTDKEKVRMDILVKIEEFLLKEKNDNNK